MPHNSETMAKAIRALAVTSAAGKLCWGISPLLRPEGLQLFELSIDAVHVGSFHSGIEMHDVLAEFRRDPVKMSLRELSQQLVIGLVRQRILAGRNRVSR